MTVLEAVAKSKTSTFLNKGSVKAAQKMISPSEEILWAQIVLVDATPSKNKFDTDVKIFNTDGLSGVIVITDQRILFVQHMLGQGTSKEIRLSSVRSLDTQKTTTWTFLRITSMSDMIVTYGKNREITNLRNAINDALARKEAENTPAAQKKDDDVLDDSDVAQLAALKKLYDDGILTEEEFAAKKAQILNI
jgi:hypothetical protein